MDEHTFRVLEFEKILQMTASFAVTEPGRTLTLQIRPLNRIEDTRKRLELVSECRRLMSEQRPLGIEHFNDLSSLFRKIRPADSVLDPFELRSFMPLFYSAFNLKILSGSPSGLSRIVSQLVTHPDLRKSIESSIDNEGKLRDGASPELSYIRKGIKSCEGRIKRILEELLKNRELMPHLQDFYLAERNNRWVIPVKIESKGSIQGIVHDISNTGETVYIEPYSIQPLGNELESFRAEEKLEEYRILRRLTASLRENLREIEEDYRVVVLVDSINAVAAFSEQMDMSSPELNEQGRMRIIGGRHPLLWKTLKMKNRAEDLAPLDMEIGEGRSCMVITGSNAGGKTVALKTIGVLTLMALAGMHVPAKSGTLIPFFSSVFADIGDEQSIEQNLSTFSAHITRISEIIRQSGRHSLVIIDELGTGTDPEQGGALSCAVLRRLKRQDVTTVVSTHLGMLKAFAHSEPGMINSAMEMEELTIGGITTYRPTYRLIIGEPGTSHALEIAESLGLHKDIIEEAREFIKKEDMQIESLISELKQKARGLDERLKETERMKQEVSRLRSSLDEELSKLESTKRNALAEAMREAEETIRRTKAEARDIIKNLKKARSSNAGEIVKELDRKHKEIIMMREMLCPVKIKPLRDIKEKQPAFIKTLGKHGVVHSINKKAQRCKVMVGGKEITIPFTELFEPAPDISEQRDHVSAEDVKVTAYRVTPHASEYVDIPDELNVIGMRVDPALSLIERYLNDASLAGLKYVKIIHGIGAGILSKAIRDYLKDHPLVESSRAGNEDEGSEAVTIIELV